MSGDGLSFSSFLFNVSFVISKLRTPNSNWPAAMNYDPKLCKIFYMGTIFYKTLKISGMFNETYLCFTFMEVNQILFVLYNSKQPASSRRYASYVKSEFALARIDSSSTNWWKEVDWFDPNLSHAALAKHSFSEEKLNRDAATNQWTVKELMSGHEALACRKIVCWFFSSLGLDGQKKRNWLICFRQRLSQLLEWRNFSKTVKTAYRDLKKIETLERFFSRESKEIRKISSSFENVERLGSRMR